MTGFLRSNRLRGRLTRTLVGLGVVSVVLLAGVNFFIVRSLLNDNAQSQLEGVRDVRADAVELAMDRVIDRTAVFGLDPAVGRALADLEAGYLEIDDELTEEQLAELEAAYDPFLQPLDDVGAERPPTSQLLPESDQGRYVQYHYIASNGEEERGELLDAEDGSVYSEAHAQHHPFLRELAASIGATDMVLIGAQSLDVVYSVDKEIDLGTDVIRGPYAETGLGTSVAGLADVGANEATIADTEFYLPNLSAPIVHAATTVRSGTEVVGILVVTLESNALSALVNSGGDWDVLGLGDSGDAYVVGRDGTLRTIPRPYTEDPAAFVERYVEVTEDERGGELIEFTGSPVLITEVDNSVVAEAIDGDASYGNVDNYLGRSTVAAAEPLEVGGLGWVLVTEQSTSEAGEELASFIWSIVLVLLAVTGGLLIVGALLARQISRPVRPLVEAAGRIADGDYRSSIPDLGRNELGDVGRQLEAVAARLRDQEDTIEAEERRIEQMLESVLPPALVERVRGGERELADVVDTASVISVVVRGLPASAAAEQDALVELTSTITEAMAEVAAEHGVERIKVSLEQQLYVAGRSQTTYGSDAAVAFAVAAIATITAVGQDQGVDINARVGISTGLVASGVLGTRQVSFDVWGDPVTDAVSLSGRAGPGQLLAATSTTDLLGDEWSIEPTGDQTGAMSVTAAGSLDATS